MNKFQPLFFFMIALLATAAMISIGIAIAYRHVPAIVASIVALFAVMGLGFSLKRKKKNALTIR
ncbi:DUF5325 family protein [Anoxybacillus sp. KU2-6(11)]|uniref:DUF5325 family protein n=1 Tax=Anoxybacillus sp. KU2-6(11) TaxID=1535751 RepID=UPI000504E8D3|nr:DUF5325 family protein [Anoxybacillus sp. KU2-6(11)]KFZ43533.1 hypothetical protein JS80_02430 [Anoxybacillus sp. KU2-6(11)]